MVMLYKILNQYLITGTDINTEVPASAVEH